MKLLVLSDIHGNLSALDAVLADACVRHSIEGVVLLGDVIDYGMRSNEVVSRIMKIELPVVTSIWGNHEKAIMEEDYSRFSSARGAECARYTASALTEKSREWVDSALNHAGRAEFMADGKRCLAVHGSAEDPFWKAIAPMRVKAEDYSDYDVVFSGHNHLPHAFGLLVKSDNPETRNQRLVEFVNPGSVGQPRNRSPRACYAVFDTKADVSLCSVEYPVDKEQSFYLGQVDDFYRKQLALGV